MMGTKSANTFMTVRVLIELNILQEGYIVMLNDFDDGYDRQVHSTGDFRPNFLWPFSRVILIDARSC